MQATLEQMTVIEEIGRTLREVRDVHKRDCKG
jgi:hypothetical protein